MISEYTVGMMAEMYRNGSITRDQVNDRLWDIASSATYITVDEEEGAVATAFRDITGEHYNTAEWA